MFYFNELSIAEIAQALEISEGTVKSRLNSSRAKMKTAIEDYENKSGDKLGAPSVRKVPQGRSCN